MKHVVVDLEMNPVDREFREVRKRLRDEVIEIGAVKLGEDYVQESTFRCYVKPEYGPIKKHITRLTSITQAMVDTGEVFEPSFHAFVDWVGEEETTIYSWSMSDIKQLKSECSVKLKDFDVRWLDSRWVDLQQEFAISRGHSTRRSMTPSIRAPSSRSCRMMKRSARRCSPCLTSSSRRMTSRARSATSARSS